MRNLKKILALVLALVMSFSIMTVSSAAFKDQDKIDETYAEAIDVLSALKVFEGYENGKFDPKGLITRAEVAAIIYRVATGDVDNRQAAMYADMNAFTDVKSNDWFAGYVNYCASAKYIKGRGDGTFDPQGKVTGFEALAMILRAIGYDKNNEFTGEAYTVEVAKVAQTRKITENLKNVTLGASATREVVAEILFKTITIEQVSYSAINQDYTIYTNHLQNDTNETLAYDSFELVRYDGIIDGVDRLEGSTTLHNWNLTFTNTKDSWEKIGYAAHIWAVDTDKREIKEAITATYIDGTSLLVNHDGSSFADLTDEKEGLVKMDERNGFRLFVNGMPKYRSYISNGDTYTTAIWYNLPALYANMVEERGTKVDFVDNDNAGKIDAVIITDYTFAQVDGVATDINAGSNAVKYKNFYFRNQHNTLQRESFHVDNIVYAGNLAKGDYVTYVVYNEDIYVYDVTTVDGKFSRIDKKFVELMGATDYQYYIADVPYAKSADVSVVEDVLVYDNLGKDVIAGLDQFGYVVYSTFPNPDPINYMYVFSNEETHKKVTFTTVVVYDAETRTASVMDINVGSVTYVDPITEKGTTVTYFDDSTDATDLTEADGIKNVIYTYTEKDGVYALTESHDFTYNKADHKAGDAQYGEKGLNKNTVLVDVRSEKVLGTVYVGHTGENAVPGLKDMETLSFYHKNGILDWGFLMAGTDFPGQPGKDVVTEREFVVFTTRENYTTGSKFYLDVIIDGELVEDYELSKYEYGMIDTYGVGLYNFTYVADYLGNPKSSSMTYTTFGEVWENIAWDNDTLIRLEQPAASRYVEYGTVPFLVLDIENGTVQNYVMTEGDDANLVKAYVIYANDAVAAILLINDSTNVADQYDNREILGANLYYVQHGEITVKVEGTVEAEVTAAVADLNAAVAELDAAVAALNAYVEAQTKAAAEETVTLQDLYAAVAAAKAKVEAAVKAVYDVWTSSIDAVVFEAVKAANEAAAKATETYDDVIVKANAIVADVMAGVELNVTIAAELNIVYSVDADVKAMIVEKASSLINAAVATDADLAEVMANGAEVTVELVESTFDAEKAVNTVDLKVTLTLGSKTVDQIVTITVTATAEVVEAPVVPEA